MNLGRILTLRSVLFVLVAIVLALVIGDNSALAEIYPTSSSIIRPAGVQPEVPIFNEPFEGEGPHNPPIWRTYKDFNAWWGENRDNATLLSLGKIQGYDYFIHPMTALQSGIPDGTAVVMIGSNSFGWYSTRQAQNHPSAQNSLNEFLQKGGVVIADMGDNDSIGGYLMPGAAGTPDLMFPSPCGDVTLDPTAVATNHPFVNGLNNSNIDVSSGCYVAHGNLVDGITLPQEATILMTATFGGVQKPVLAEYPFEGGCVIVDTITKEWEYQNPIGNGPSHIMENLFTYALNGACTNPIEIDIKPGSSPNSINCNNLDGIIPVAILTTDDFDALTVDHTTVTFEGASEAHISKKTGEARRHEEDVDGDGDKDLLFHFIFDNTGLTCDSTKGHLRGRLVDGDYIFGFDYVQMIDRGGGRIPTPTPSPYYVSMLNPPKAHQAAYTYSLLTFGLILGAVLLKLKPFGSKKH